MSGSRKKTVSGDGPVGDVVRVEPLRQYVDTETDPPPGRFDDAGPSSPIGGRSAARKIAAHAFKVLTDPAPPTPGRPTFFDVYNATRDAALSPDQKSLLFVMASRVGKDGRLWVSMDRLAAESGIHRRSVATTIEEWRSMFLLSGDLPAALEPTEPIGLAFAEDLVARLARWPRAFPSRVASGEP